MLQELLERKLHNVWQSQKSTNGYAYEAFEFVYEALPTSNTARAFFKKSDHITSEQFCTAFVEQARNHFGALAPTVLQYWGIFSFSDLGKIVQILVDNSLLNCNPEDFPFPELNNLWQRFQQTAIASISSGSTKTTYQPDLSNAALPEVPQPPS